MNPKPIPTRFRGNVFRSRLEARWAVFFHHFDLQYTYEAEGYQLKTGWYLPDFWIPEWNTFVEIKPVEATDAEIEKANSLHLESDQTVLIVQGQPWIDEYFIAPFVGRQRLRPSEFSFCASCEAICLVDCDSGCAVNKHLSNSGCGDDDVRSKVWPGDFIARGLEAARSANFERMG